MKYHVELDVDLKRNPHEGLYIALEGIDGSGKTTHATRLKQHFEDEGHSAVIVQFPRREEGPLAGISKSALEGTSAMPKPAYQYIFSADYVVFENDTIVPTLARGDVVIADRFHCWSSAAYGIWDACKIYERKYMQSLMVANGLLSLHNLFFIPDKTLYLAVSVDTAIRRLKQAGQTKDIYEKKRRLNISLKAIGGLLLNFLTNLSCLMQKNLLTK